MRLPKPAEMLECNCGRSLEPSRYIILLAILPSASLENEERSVYITHSISTVLFIVFYPNMYRKSLVPIIVFRFTRTYLPDELRRSLSAPGPY